MILSCSVLVAVAGCEKKAEPKLEQKAASAAVQSMQSMQKFEYKMLELPIQHTKCEGAMCPQVSIQRLSSNVPELDRAIDVFIQAYINSAVEGYDVGDEGASSDQRAASTQADSELPAYNMSEIHHDIDKFYLMANEVKSMGSAAQLSLDIKPEVIDADQPVLTVAVHAANYTGGAHGSATDQYFNYDLKQHTILNLSDTILPNKRKAFNDLAYTAYQQWIKSSQPDINLSDYQELWPFHMADNFSLSPQGLVLYYHEYDIGPYAVGRPKLLIPYDQLTGVLKQRFLPDSIKTTAAASQPVNHNP